MGSAAATLPTPKVAIGSAGATFSRRKDIWIHAEAHAAAALSPFETSRFEDIVDTFLFCLAFDCLGTRNDHRTYGLSYVVATDNSGGSAEIFDTGVGAGA